MAIKRRGNGEGSISKRRKIDKKTGKEIITWQGYVTVGYDPETGKDKKKYFYGRTRKEVQDKVDDARTQVKNGNWQEPTKMKLAEWLEIWLRDYRKHSLKVTTWESYKTMISNHVTPDLGHVRLTELKTHHLQKLYYEKQEPGGRADKKEGGLSPRTIEYINTIIKAALEQARKERLILNNPALDVNLPEYEKPDIKSLNQAEIVSFLSYAKETRHFPLYFLALNTGLRRGELLGLRWQDVDMDRRTVTIAQGLVRTSKGLVFQSPKTMHSRRTVTIGPEVINILKEHENRQDEERAEAEEAWQNLDLVFCNEIGGPLCPRALSRHFERLLKRAGLEGFTLHGLRHTYATISLEVGVSPKTIQEYLGHHSSIFTLDIYSSVTKQMQQDADDKIGGKMAHLLNKEKNIKTDDSFAGSVKEI